MWFVQWFVQCQKSHLNATGQKNPTVSSLNMTKFEHVSSPKSLLEVGVCHKYSIGYAEIAWQINVNLG